MKTRGKPLIFLLGICLALSACQGRMPPPPPESSAAPAASAPAPEPPVPAAPPAEETGTGLRPESAAPSSRPEEASPPPPGSSAEAPAPEPGEGMGASGGEAPSRPEEPASESGRPEEPTSPEEPTPPEEASSQPEEEPEQPEQPEEPTEPELPEGCRWQSITEASLLTLINKERVRQRQVPLTYDPELARAARLRAEELFRGNYVAHTRPDGSPWETVLRQEVPTEYAYAGENLAWSNHAPGEEPGAFQWFSLWKESKSHLAAMVGERYTHCGVAVLTGPYYEGEAQSYAVAVFCSY